MVDPIYFVKDTDILYRRSDGDRAKLLPDEVLHPSGWRPLPATTPDPWPGHREPSPTAGGGAPDPLLLDQIVEIDVSEAKRIAKQRGLPTEGW